MKKEGSKREHGPNFCFDFWVRFGDHRALYHIPIVIIPTLGLIISFHDAESDYNDIWMSLVIQPNIYSLGVRCQKKLHMFRCSLDVKAN